MTPLTRLRQPLVADDPSPTTIGIGVSLAGTVSSGAWTAGVLDALFDALDAWEEQKEAGRPVPRHNIRLEVVGGTSGGAVCAALLARAATRRFPSISDAGGNDQNPFWLLWVKTLRLLAMLTPEAARADSLLAGKALEDGVNALLNWQGAARPRRKWLADRLHFVFTQTNLRGVPYGIEFRPAGPGDAPRRSMFTSHADHARFELLVSGTGATASRGDARVVLSEFNSSDARARWQDLADHARASGAFPLGFPPVRLRRPRSDYDWRGVMLSRGSSLPPEPRLLEPSWRPGEPSEFVYDAVDGGAANVNPVALVLEGLTGLGRQLEADPSRVRRLLVSIDPFAANKPPPPPPERTDLVDVGAGLISALVANGRFDASELLLALDEQAPSRFLLTAGRDRAPKPDGSRERAWGTDALATSGLGAFLGFVDESLSAHDFLLGKQNAFAWMRKHFTLPAGHPVFGGFAASEHAADFLVDEGRSLPVIPVLPEVYGSISKPAWPRPNVDLATIKTRAAQRFSDVFGTVAQARLDAAAPCAPLLGMFGAGYLVKQIERALADLKERG